MALTPEQITENKTTLYRKLLWYIDNPCGVAALMGNIWKESAGTFDPRIVQGYSASTFDNCITYTINVDTGVISSYDFIHNGPNGGGYGIIQWTYYTRKEALYNLKVSKTYSSIGSRDLQVEYLNIELNGYPTTKSAIDGCTVATISDVTVTICDDFLRPEASVADKPNRIANALSIYEECKDLTPLAPGDEPGPVPPTPVTRSKLPIWLLHKITNERR